MSGITVNERVLLGYKQIERHYTDEEILELFPDNEGSMVNALLCRAQSAEQQLAAVTAERDDAAGGMRGGSEILHRGRLRVD